MFNEIEANKIQSSFYAEINFAVGPAGRFTMSRSMTPRDALAVPHI